MKMVMVMVMKIIVNIIYSKCIYVLQMNGLYLICIMYYVLCIMYYVIL
jgi:hypothetical protein